MTEIYIMLLITQTTPDIFNTSNAPKAKNLIYIELILDKTLLLNRYVVKYKRPCWIELINWK